MVDSNAAITGTFKIVMDTVTLAQGWQKCVIPANNLGKVHSR
jgi:hypothetical protein